MMLGYKSNNNVVYSNKYHVIWCPKYRRKVLVGDIAKRLAEIMRKTALKYRAEIIALEIIPDHVHMLCEVDPQFGIHRFVKNIKGVTSHVLRKEFVRLIQSRINRSGYGVHPRAVSCLAKPNTVSKAAR